MLGRKQVLRLESILPEVQIGRSGQRNFLHMLQYRGVFDRRRT